MLWLHGVTMNLSVCQNNLIFFDARVTKLVDCGNAMDIMGGKVG